MRRQARAAVPRFLRKPGRAGSAVCPQQVPIPKAVRRGSRTGLVAAVSRVALSLSIRPLPGQPPNLGKNIVKSHECPENALHARAGMAHNHADRPGRGGFPRDFKRAVGRLGAPNPPLPNLPLQGGNGRPITFGLILGHTRDRVPFRKKQRDERWSRQRRKILRPGLRFLLENRAAQVDSTRKM